MKKKSIYQGNDLGRYSGYAFQMGIIIFLGTFGGLKLDQYIDTSPLFIIIGSLGSIALAIYVMIHNINIKDKKNGKKTSH